MRKIILLFFVLTSSIIVAAQEVSPIFTDRPNATDAAALLLVGEFQAEVGFFNDTDTNNGNTDRSITQPNLSLKYGVLDWLEVRVLTNYLTQVNNVGSGATRTSGITPITLSPKFKLLEKDGFIRNLALTTSFTFPNVGEKAFQNNKLNFGYRLLMNNRLTDRIDWSHSFGTDWDDNANDSWIYTSSFGFGLTDKLGAFTELYTTFDAANNDFYWDGGLTYLILDNLVVDAMVGVGLNNSASDYFVSVGFGWKTSFKR